MPKVLITTVPFGSESRSPIDALESAGINYLINPIGRKLKEDELAEMIGDFEVLIAGTEKISEKVMSRANRLKFISRVGVGLDSVDLLAAERRGIGVSYTPDAPAPAVIELTIGLMLSLLRSIHIANSQMHKGEWQRHFGRCISDITVGIIGVGRIGSGVLKRLSAFAPLRILVNDTHPKLNSNFGVRVEWVDKETIYRESDLLSIHVPLTGETENMIRRDQLLQMKQNAMIINTARGGIINELDLANVLISGHLGGVAIDVFGLEPYVGELTKIERCLLTSHMGSMSLSCRARMEMEATQEAIRYLHGLPLCGVVPIQEYDIRRLVL